MMEIVKGRMMGAGWWNWKRGDYWVEEKGRI